MSEMTTIARPYAKAAFAYAVENNAVENWQEMLVFAAEVSANDAIQELLTGALAADSLADLFVQVCGEQLNEAGQNFIRVLADNRRLKALPAVLALFNELKAEYDKEIDVQVTSTVELSDEQTQKIAASLEKRLARKVKLNCNVDSTLIAGLVIKAGDTVIDGSVKSTLSRLTDALQA
ncbi:F0F1 ATP synthase subunit delta [Bowmanella sp. JS7-9]|jgi:F-type H+-transporting ATPase subunit delta|uniref:ATP synthase subunit delta n=1 Tax=Pseudobowmanella zhangzhouensis TaxID=1537679 RepID=A0ABW1XNA6_9ALTE|nr:F0F1 ATP synthase subunit delta [Bowmanella sp. JS7-9]TBX24410.1 ATP F0F1 synthase subunit delta [Bowmanella sp. JS7-9]